jgi:hypothetical protein
MHSLRLKEPKKIEFYRTLRKPTEMKTSEGCPLRIFTSRGTDGWAPHLARFSRDVGYHELQRSFLIHHQRFGEPPNWTGAPRSEDTDPSEGLDVRGPHITT